VVADDRKPAKGAVQEVDSPPPSDEVSEGVPDDRTGSGGDDSSQWHGAPRSRHSTQDHRDLTREDEAHKGRGL
jgi:hypothetical protein